MVEFLISHGVNINGKDEYGEFALRTAISNNNKEMTEFLISHGAKFNEKVRIGKTALQLAA